MPCARASFTYNWSLSDCCGFRAVRQRSPSRRRSPLPSLVNVGKGRGPSFKLLVHFVCNFGNCPKFVLNKEVRLTQSCVWSRVYFVEQNIWWQRRDSRKEFSRTSLPRGWPSLSHWIGEFLGYQELRVRHFPQLGKFTTGLLWCP